MGMERNGTPAAQQASEAVSKRRKWDAYYMGFAAHAGSASKANTKVGAVLIGKGGEILMTGYNGPPKGVDDLPNRIVGPDRYLFASHAEQNVIGFCARTGVRTEGATLYVTCQPCASCAKSIIQAGIRQVVYGAIGAQATSMPPEEFRAAMVMFAEAGVVSRQVESS